ncbi:MAG: hypothetical protein M3Z24_09980 [Chloroflexota bacterium]|nr:hypothetical protein [Chloroflexota bacterium]
MVVLTDIVLPPIALDSFILISVLFAIIGTLYLAYDLLGRQDGPLSWLTLIITCGLVSALILGFVGTVIFLLTNHHYSLNFTLQALVIGGLMGVFTVILIDFPKSQEKPRIISPKGSATGLAFGLLFFCTVLFLLRIDVNTALAMGVTCTTLASIWPYLTWNPSPSRPPVFSGKGFGIGFLSWLLFWFAFFFLASEDAVASMVVSVPLALVCGVLISLWRFIHWEASDSHLHVFSRRGFQLGFVIGFIPWLIFQLTQIYAGFADLHVKEPLEVLAYMGIMLLIVIVVGALALASAAAGSISRYMLWKANTLPVRRLGVIGLVLILLATSLQGVQPAIDLINILSTSK